MLQRTKVLERVECSRVFRSFSMFIALVALTLLSLTMLSTNLRSASKFFVPRHVSSIPVDTIPLPKVRGYLVRTNACRIPDFEPYDQTVWGHFRTLRNVSCSIRPPLIRQSGNVLYLDETSLRAYYGADPAGINCVYKSIERNMSAEIPDKTALYGEATTLKFGIPMNVEYIKVQCSIRSAVFHQEFFLLPVLKPTVEAHCEEAIRRAPPKREDISVVILLLDSVSRLNYLRFLTRTREYLKRFEPIEMKGLTKVGDNSFPNQVGMLTGKQDKELRENCSKKFFDDEDIIWKRYSRRGYRTVFLEEKPGFGLFNYLCPGFRNTPTDYYTRPAILAIQWSRLKVYAGELPCVGTKPQTSTFLNYTTSLLAFLGDRPHFSFTSICDVTHEHVDTAGYADIPYRQAFETLYTTGVMNRSLILFLSDHGTRYGSIRTTLMGKYEDRLPFCFFLFPPAFRQKYPNVMRNLRVNQGRLTTPFDIHATLLELLDFPSTADSPEFRTDYGLSLLHEIPENRTCSDAFLSPHWCCCQETKQAASSDEQSVRMAAFMLDTINSWMEKGAPGKCQQLLLGRVISVQERLLTTAVAGTSFFWVTALASNTNAIVEGTVSVRDDGAMNMHDIVSRLNQYGSNEACISSHLLERYCACK